jgi:hypothetical protein
VPDVSEPDQQLVVETESAGEAVLAMLIDHLHERLASQERAFDALDGKASGLLAADVAAPILGAVAVIGR